MKDSYSFDRDQEGLQRSYERHIEAYDRIFDRAGLRWYRVAGDVGHDGRAAARTSTWRRARPARTRSRWRPATRPTSRSPAREAQPVELPAPPTARRWRSHTPGATTIAAVAGQLGLPAGATAEGVPGRRRGPRPGAGDACAATTASTRSSSASALGAPWRPASARGDRASGSARPGFIGPVGVGRAGAARRRRRAGRLRRRRQPPRHAPARRRAGPRLRLRARRRAHRRGRRPGRRAPDHDRAGDRGRQHLPARHALLARRSARATSTSRAASS